MGRSPVLLSHDGGIDDFLALLLLTTLEHVDLLGVVVTPADCYLEAAVSVSRKILHWRSFDHVPVMGILVRGVNPFPPEYRRDCLIIDRLPILNERPLPETVASSLPSPITSTESSAQRIKRLLEVSKTPVTWLETGPLTTLAQLLQDGPELRDKLERIVWMGGALVVDGNVEPQFAPEHDGSAEWNAFWDPAAVRLVLQQAEASRLPFTLCPLDATNRVPVTAEFIQKLARQRKYPCSDFAGQCYALAACQDYYCWDVLTATYVAAPELFDIQGTENDVKVAIETQAQSQGRTQLNAHGHPVQVISPKDPAQIQTYLLEQWSQ